MQKMPKGFSILDSLYSLACIEFETLRLYSIWKKKKEGGGLAFLLSEQCQGFCFNGWWIIALLSAVCTLVASFYSFLFSCWPFLSGDWSTFHLNPQCQMQVKKDIYMNLKNQAFFCCLMLIQEFIDTNDLISFVSFSYRKSWSLLQELSALHQCIVSICAHTILAPCNNSPLPCQQ
jgi:hypothetical protein